jgi:hypothetical protein
MPAAAPMRRRSARTPRPMPTTRRPMATAPMPRA